MREVFKFDFRNYPGELFRKAVIIAEKLDNRMTVCTIAFDPETIKVHGDMSFGSLWPITGFSIRHPDDYASADVGTREAIKRTVRSYRLLESFDGVYRAYRMFMRFPIDKLEFENGYWVVPSEEEYRAAIAEEDEA